VLREFRGKALAKLEEIHLKRLDVPLTGGGFPSKDGPFIIRGLVDLIFSMHDFGVTLKNALIAPILQTLQDGGEDLREEIGRDDPWEMPPKKAQEYLLGRTQQIVGVGETVRGQINTTLEEGITAGETHEELAARVRGTFTKLADFESKRIARTEVNGAFNTARQQAMVDSGVEYKAWLSSHGPHVRDGHQQAEEDYLDDPIPIDEPFLVDLDGVEQKLMFPGDASLGADAGTLINCECLQLAAQKKNENAH
jgi:hypothetical protein